MFLGGFDFYPEGMMLFAKRGSPSPNFVALSIRSKTGSHSRPDEESVAKQGTYEERVHRALREGVSRARGGEQDGRINVCVCVCVDTRAREPAQARSRRNGIV